MQPVGRVGRREVPDDDGVIEELHVGLVAGEIRDQIALSVLLNLFLCAGFQDTIDDLRVTFDASTWR